MTKEKLTYVSPETETLVVRFEGMVCTSPNGSLPDNADVNDQSNNSTNWW